MRRALALSIALAGFCGCNSYCNRRVFEQVEPSCDATIANDVDIPAEKASDILIVVDNSGSMQEEQDRMAAAFINDNPAQCPIGKNDLKDFARCKTEPELPVCLFVNPSLELLAAPGPAGLSQCGFIQVLAAFENDFRIGVITTDVGLCDNRVSEGQAAECRGSVPLGGGVFSDGTCVLTGAVCNPATNKCANDWGFRAQRGCLQPNGPPGTTLKVIARPDLDSPDAATNDIGQRFIDTLSNVRTFGSSIERGLDAMQIFLDPNSDRGPGCDGDLDAFLRDDAKLIVIFLTDEEDCSRLEDVGDCAADDDGDGGIECGACNVDGAGQCTEAPACDDPNGCEIFDCPAGGCTNGRTEFTGETCGEFASHFSANPAGLCYDNVASLTPPDRYVAFLKSLKRDPSDVSVAVIAGGLLDADGGITPGGCTFNDAAGQGQIPLGTCRLSQGNSNGQACQASGDCCFADPGTRYYDLATGMNGLKDTICVDSFGQTMIKIAVFIADVTFVDLAEPPENPALVFVETAAAGSEDFTTVARINDTVCGDPPQNGWVLEDNGTRVRFCGDARPTPGEKIRVRAKGEGANGKDPNACAGRGQ